MGEKQTKPFQLSFNGSLKVDFQGSHVTSDGGLILVRELDERLGLGELIDEHLSDSRQGTNKQFTLADLLRQSVYSRLAGYEDLNDAERISIDPTFRLIGSQKIWDRGAALTSTLHGFETEMLASEENLLGLLALNRELVGPAEAFDDSERVVLDMDSTESPVHGQQEGSAYNGHFESVCYHPLLLFNQHGDCLAAKLRPGNVHSAEDWDELLLPEIERQQAAGKLVAFRGDAAFAKPEIYEASEERGVQYAIRIPANRSLELEIEDILFRPPGRPGRKPLVRYNGRGFVCPIRRRAGRSRPIVLRDCPRRPAGNGRNASSNTLDGLETQGQPRLRFTVRLRARSPTMPGRSPASRRFSCRIGKELRSATLLHRVWREPTLVGALHGLQRLRAGLYLDPPRTAAVFSVDQRNATSSARPSRPRLRLSPGHARSI